MIRLTRAKRYLVLATALFAACYDEPAVTSPPNPSQAALSDSTDRTKWRLRLEGDYAGNPIVAPDGTIYVVTVNGTLYAIDPAGTVRWTHVTGGGAIWGPLSLAGDGTIIVAGERSVMAVTPAGSRKWTFTGLGDYLVGGPNIGPDGNIYGVTDLLGIGLFSLTPNGELRFNTGQFSTYGNNHSAIAFSSGRLFFTLDMRTLRTQPTFFGYDLDGTLRFEIPAVSPNASPTASPNGNIIIYHGSPLNAYNPDGQLVWTFYDPQPTGWLRPTIGPDNVLYGVQAQAHLYSVDPNGNKRWLLSDTVILKSPGLRPQNDVLIMGGRINYGMPGFFQAVSTDGEPLWRMALPDEPGFEPYGQLEPTSRPAFSPDGGTAYSSVDVLEASPGTDYFYLYAIEAGEPSTVQNPENHAPSARTNGPYEAGEGRTIAFASTGSSDPDGDALSYHWSFGNGKTSTLANPSYRYPDNGTYLVTLTVTDARGAVGTQRTLATISNVAPTGSFGAPASILEGSSYTLTINGTDAGAADRSTLQVSLDCGQGAGYGAAAVRSASVACPAVPDQRMIAARARVRDKDGAESEYVREVAVTNARPTVVLRATGVTTIRAGETISFEGSFADAGVNDAPWSYAFSWGDGESSEPARTRTQGAVIRGSHAFATPGTYRAYLRVRDKDGDVGSSTRITVVVDP